MLYDEGVEPVLRYELAPIEGGPLEGEVPPPGAVPLSVPASPFIVKRKKTALFTIQQHSQEKLDLKIFYFYHEL